jgi:predicted N-formylglutamate amidohydrolase
MLQSEDSLAALLSPRDPHPVEIVNAEGGSDIVLSCEHAGRAVPDRLGDLGVSPADMERHIAWDVGAEEVSRRLSALLDAPLVMQRYSRLVVDCNRPFNAQDCFPKVSDGTRVPGNEGLCERERQQRFKYIHQPFHHALAQVLDRRADRPTCLVASHSFTPRLADGKVRPWHLGALFNRDSRLADRFLATFKKQNPDILAVPNEPYMVDDFSDYTIPLHGEGRGLPHLLLEIRNDMIADQDGQKRWAALVAEALSEAIADERDSIHGQ